MITKPKSKGERKWLSQKQKQEKEQAALDKKYGLWKNTGGGIIRRVQ